MSKFSLRILHSFDIAGHPDLETDAQRAMLARWASDRSAVKNKPALHKPPSATNVVQVDNVLAALRSLDSQLDTIARPNA